MTQIVAGIRRGIVFQASDRLLTSGRGTVARDRRSNKALVVWAADGVVLIGYSGDAFDQSTPMDDWLAGAVCSDPSAEWLSAGMPNDLAQLRIDQVVSRIQAWMDKRRTAMTTSVRASSYLLVQVVGLRKRGGRTASTFAARLEATPRTSSTRRTFFRNDGGLRGGGLVVTTPDLGASLATVREEVSKAESWLDLRKAVVVATQRASMRPGVGDDLLCIGLNPTCDPPIWLWHLVGAQGQDLHDAGAGAVSVRYTPWLVTAWGVIAPSVTDMDEIGLVDTRIRMVWGNMRKEQLRANALSAVAFRQNRDMRPSDVPELLIGPQTRSLGVRLDEGEHVLELRSGPLRRGSR